MHKIIFQKKALKQIALLKNDNKLLQKLGQIIEEIAVDPYLPSHRFERLKHQLAGYCSKRLDQKNRVLYSVQGDIVTVQIVSVLGHYDD